MSCDSGMRLCDVMVLESMGHDSGMESQDVTCTTMGDNVWLTCTTTVRLSILSVSTTKGLTPVPFTTCQNQATVVHVYYTCF